MSMKTKKEILQLNNEKKFLKSIEYLIENGKYELAEREIIKNLNDNPYNEKIRIYYVKFLIKQERYDEAILLCENFLHNNAIKFQYALVNKKLGNNELAKKYFLDSYKTNNENVPLFQLINIYLKEENYEKAYEYYLKLDMDNCYDRDYSISIIKKYIYANMFPYENTNDSRYYQCQIDDFDIDKAKTKICNTKVNEKYSFSSDIDLNDLYEKVKLAIQDTDYNDYDLFDTYMFYYPNIGKVDNKSVNYLTASTIINTKNVVDIKPCNYYGDKKLIDISEKNVKKFKMNSKN